MIQAILVLIFFPKYLPLLEKELWVEQIFISKGRTQQRAKGCKIMSGLKRVNRGHHILLPKAGISPSLKSSAGGLKEGREALLHLKCN